MEKVELRSCSIIRAMRWLVNEQEFKEAHLRAMTCVFIDSGRESTSLHRAVFDDASVCTPDFAQLSRWTKVFGHGCHGESQKLPDCTPAFRRRSPGDSLRMYWQ